MIVFVAIQDKISQIITKIKIMTDIFKNTQVPKCIQTDVIRSFYFKNNNIFILIICVLGLVYVNLALPFRVKRIDYGDTFLEAMY